MGEGPSRRRTLSWLASGATLALGAAAMAGCGPRQKVLRPHLVIWHGFRGAEKAALEKLAALYSSRLKPGQRPVRAVAIPSDAMADKISASVPRGKGPDLFIFGHDRLGGWAEVGDTITPLDFFLDQGMKDAFLPNMFDAVTYRDAVWALPFNYKSIALLYNKKLIDTPPQTTDELVALAKAHTDVARGRFGLAYAYDDFFLHAALMNGFGGGVFDANGRLMLDDPRNIAASNLVQSWRGKLDLLPDDPTSSLVASLFNSGRAAMIFNGPWFLGEIAPEIEFGAAVLPKISEAQGRPMAPYMAVEAIFMCAGTHDPAEAWSFARFLTSLEAARVMAIEGGELPTLQAVYETPEVARNPIVQAFKAQALTAVAMPNLPEMTMVWSPADKAMKRVTKLETTSEAAWQDCQREVQAAIDALHAGKTG